MTKANIIAEFKLKALNATCVAIKLAALFAFVAIMSRPVTEMAFKDAVIVGMKGAISGSFDPTIPMMVYDALYRTPSDLNYLMAAIGLYAIINLLYTAIKYGKHD